MRSLRIFVFVGTPFLITRSHAERSGGSKAKIPDLTKGTMVMVPGPLGQSQQQAVLAGPKVDAGPVDPAVYARLGFGPRSGSESKTPPDISPQANIPVNMSAGVPFSTAIATNVAKFNETDTLGD